MQRAETCDKCMQYDRLPWHSFQEWKLWNLCNMAFEVWVTKEAIAPYLWCTLSIFKKAHQGLFGHNWNNDIIVILISRLALILYWCADSCCYLMCEQFPWFGNHLVHLLYYHIPIACHPDHVRKSTCEMLRSKQLRWCDLSTNTDSALWMAVDWYWVMARPRENGNTELQYTNNTRKIVWIPQVFLPQRLFI